MLILGSSSQFRQNQLAQLEVEFKTYSPDIDEDIIKNDNYSPLEVSQKLSVMKAKETLKNFPNDIVIGADQVLSFKGKIFSKPGNIENAIEQLIQLSGQTHELISSYCVLSKDKESTHSITSHMTMRKLTRDQITNYINKDLPLYSCGSYKLETLGIALFSEIVCPDHSAIIGLPLISLASTLEDFGIKIL